MTGAWVAVAVLAVTTVFGLVWRGRDGRLRPVERGGSGASVESRRDRLRRADLGAELGERATLVQFSTAFCAPCRATRHILREIADTVDGVAHVEIDAESHLDLVRRLKILRTPTVLVLDQDGLIVRRAAGRPRKPDIIAALGRV